MSALGTADGAQNRWANTPTLLGLATWLENLEMWKDTMESDEDDM